MSYIIPEYAIWINLIIIVIIAILLAVMVYITRVIHGTLIKFKEHMEAECNRTKIIAQDSHIDYGEYEQTNIQYEPEEYVPPTSSDVKMEIDKSDDGDDFGDISNNNVEKAYKNLMDNIVKKYNLRVSITPGELVEEMTNYNPNIVNDLRYITNIYELHVYGDRELPDDLKTKYFRKIRKLSVENR
jgi:hypothetical protein